MTIFIGGMASTYYAGLSLVIVGTGLLFVWPPRVVLRHPRGHPDLIRPAQPPPRTVGSAAAAISNLAFLIGHARSSPAPAQIVLYGAQHKR